MKKRFCFMLAVLSAGLVISCGKKTASAQTVVDISQEIQSVNFDFSYEKADGEGYAVIDKSSIDIEDIDVDIYAASEELMKSATEPEIKSLSDYKIKYNIARLDLNNVQAKLAVLNSGTQINLDKRNLKAVEKEFKVLSWGPETVPALMNKPVLYVTFNKPARAMTALREVNADKQLLKISPEVKGRWYWNGTRQLCFKPSENLDPCQVYTMTVKADITDTDGVKLSGKTEFQTKAESVQIKYLAPGMSFEDPKKNYIHNSGGVPVKAASSVGVTVNAQISEQQFRQAVSVTCNQNTWDYSAIPVEIKYNKEQKKYEAVKLEKSRLFIVTFQKSFPVNSHVKFNIVGETKYSKSFQTLQPFSVFSEKMDMEEMKIYIRTNQPVDAKTVNSIVSIKYSDGEEIPVSQKNYEVNNTSIIVKNLKIKFNSKIQVTYNFSSVKDIYGQSCVSQEDRKTYDVPGPRSYMAVLDTGMKILEAQYPHKFIIEHQNLVTGRYKVSSVDDPYFFGAYQNTLLGDEESKDFKYDNLNPVKLNEASNDIVYIDEIDLDPYLQHGLGFVKIVAQARVRYWDTWDECERIYTENSKVTSIQVTDLAATCRVGYDRALVLVRKMSTNEPVSGAQVYFYENTYSACDIDKKDSIKEKALFYGKTDSKGFAEIVIPSSVRDRAAMVNEDRLFVFIEKGDDKLTYNVNNHDSYKSAVSQSWCRDQSRVEYDNFLFTDRGLYKPGETVSFRGIARYMVRQAGRFSRLTDLQIPDKHKYSINIKSYSWEDESVYAKLSGIFSKSGGYFGSFELPKDMEPGRYYIEVSDEDTGEKVGTQEFTVAYFERAKFQVKAGIPDLEYYPGDTLNADVKASYLAGGALNDATYEANWYSIPARYTPPGPNSRGFVFGTRDYNNADSEYKRDQGSLSTDGTVKLSIPAKKHNEPYRYDLEVAVTDVSNQRIFAGAGAIVHPAKFYIGIQSVVGSGFIKAGQKERINYILLKPNGELADTKLFKEQPVYELSRTYWTSVSRNGVDGSVYKEWISETEVVAGGKLPSAAKGAIDILPKNTGWYTLKITANDVFGNTTYTENNFFVTGSDYYWYNRDDSQNIKLTPNQDKYNPGETAVILLESPLEAGDYLVTVERNEVYSSQVIHVDTSCTTLEIPVKAEYFPVAYVSVSSWSVRKGNPSHQYKEKDYGKPAGYYGVTAVNISLDYKRFKVDITPDKSQYLPGENVTLNFKATYDNQPLAGAELTAMVVDRAVIDLINYHVPDPMGYFYGYGKYPLGVRGGDSRTLLMDPVTYKVKNLQGGDALARANMMEDGDSKDEERKDFRPTALFEPVVVTDAAGKARVTFKLPDSLTTFRITAFGVNNDKFALSEGEILVCNPINVQAVQPRRMRLRDTAECGVLITNMGDAVREVKVEANIRVPAKDYEEDAEKGLITQKGKADLDGKSVKVVKVEPGKSVPVYFNVAALGVGNVEIVYNVNAGDFKDKLVSRILIEKTYITETVATLGTVSDRGREQIVIPGWAEDNYGSLSVTLDPTRLSLMNTSVHYVFDYPYGCIEQQSSRILPLLIFGKYIDELGLSSKVKDPDKTIRDWFKTIKKEQLSNGLFPYWPGGKFESIYVSLRMSYIYALALERGYKPADIGYDIDKLNSALLSEVAKNDYYNAYACYVISLTDAKAVKTRLDALYEKAMKKDCNYTLETYCHIALAYINSGNKHRASALAKKIMPYVIAHNRTVSISDSYEGSWGNLYDTSSGTKALIMQLLVELDPKDETVDKILTTLLLEQKRGYWQSTAATARVFEAVHKVIKARNLEQLDFSASAKISDGHHTLNFINGVFKGLGAKPVIRKEEFSSKEINALKRNKLINIDFEKQGTGDLYYTVEMKYALPDELQIARDEGFEVMYTICDADTGKELTTTSPSSKVIVLESGKCYKIKVQVVTTHAREYVATRIAIPSGCEIVDSTLATGGAQIQYDSDEKDFGYGTDWGRWYYGSTQKFYDNEAQYMSEYLWNGNATYNFTIRASRRGVYPCPPVMTECMYEPEVFGRSEGYLFIVK